MKRVLALMLAIAMVASLAILTGCGNEDAKKATANETTNENKTYVIYSDNAFAPFEYLDEETNVYVGVDMDLLAAIAEDQGIKYEMHNEGFDASMGAVQSGQADAMIAGMTIKPEREETFDFSNGYFEDGQVLVVKKDSDIKEFTDLKGKTVACKTSTAGGDFAESIKEQYGFTINYYEGSNEMYQAVLNGVDSACFEDFSVIGWAIKQGGTDLSIVSEVVNSAPYGFAVKKGTNAELIEKFNKGLENIKASGKYKEILAKYGY
ncbi:MAG: transporter substrate-binding domain-containing protein [Oscillospiraceae bacterium]|nr:transporter substrate-binding domain-containing protein [Candidatus Ruminococcus equi]